MLHALKPKIILTWLLIGIVLPLTLQRISATKLEKNHGVTVQYKEGSKYEPTFQAALDQLAKDRPGRKELTGYVWIQTGGEYLLLLKGNVKCAVFVNERQALQKTKLTGTAFVKFAKGLSQITIRLEPGPSKAPPKLLFLWSKDLVAAEDIPATITYLQEVPQSTVVEERILNIVGIIARLNILLLILWILLRLTYGAQAFRPALSTAGAHAGVFIALLLMFAVRFAGLQYQLQETLHPDELLYGGMIQQIRNGHLAPAQLLYTTGFLYISAGTQKVGEWIAAAEIDQHLIQRLVSAFCSFLTCVLVYQIGSSLMNRRAGIIAMFLIGFAFLPVELAHIGIVEPTMVFFFTLALASLVAACKEPSMRNFAIAGLIGGIAIAVKQTAALIGLPLLITCFLLWKQKNAAVAMKAIGLWAFCAALGFFALSPGTVLNFNKFYEYQQWQAQSLQGLAETHNFFLDSDQFGHLAFQGLHVGIGYPFMLAAAAGLFFIWKFSRDAGLFLVPVTLAYLLLISKATAVPEHYVLLLCPLFALLAAATVEFVASKRRWLMALLVAFILIPDLKDIFTLQKLLHQTDTRRQAEQWCYRNLPPSTKIDYDFFGPRLLIPMFDAQRVKLFSRPDWNEYISKRSTQLFIQDAFTSNIFLTHPQNFPTEKQWYDSVAKGKLIKQFDGEEFFLLNPQIKIYDISNTVMP